VQLVGNTLAELGQFVRDASRSRMYRFVGNCGHRSTAETRVLKAFLDFFRHLRNPPPADTRRVSLAEAGAFWSAFNDGPLPESLLRSADAAGVLLEDAGCATFDENSSKNWWSYTAESPFDIDWFDFVASALEGRGLKIELDFSGETTCSARSAGRAICIHREQGLSPHVQHDRFLNAIKTILPEDLEFRPMMTNVEPVPPLSAMACRPTTPGRGSTVRRPR
jgi:hypothetical protein